MKNSSIDQTINKKSSPITSKKKNCTISQKFQYACGDKQFIKTFFKLFLPSAAQNFVIVLVMFLNNMYLAIFCGAEVKTSVALADPINSFVLFVLIAWSGGVAVMMSQYYGGKEYQKNQQVLVFSFISASILMLPFLIVLAVIPMQLMEMSSGLDQLTALTDATNLEYGAMYLRMVSWAFVPLIFNEFLSTGLQSTEKPGISLIGAIVATVISATCAPIAIYFTKDNPMLSVVLVVSIDGIGRICQLIYLLAYVAAKKYEPIFIFKRVVVSKEVWTKTIRYGYPSFLNDFLFAIFSTVQTFSIFNYSKAVYNEHIVELAANGKDFADIQNAATNVTLLMQFANVIWPGMAAATAIQIGSYLGEGRIEEAKQNSKRSLFWGFLISLTIVIFLFSVSWGVNDLLNMTEGNGDTVPAWMNRIAMYMEWAILPSILSQGIFSINYYSMKSGGSKLIVFCDAGIMLFWTALMAGLTFSGTLSHVHPALYMFMIQVDQLIRMFATLFAMKYSNWAKNLTVEENPKSLKESFLEFKNRVLAKKSTKK